MRTLLLSLLRLKTNGAQTLLYGMADEVVLRKVQIALRHHGRGYRQFEQALKHLKEVSNFRNQMLHWVPNMNPSRTTLTAVVDAWRDYTNPNDPQLSVTPEQLRQLTLWLRLFEGDLIVMLLAIDEKQSFDMDMYRTMQDAYAPSTPKPTYETPSPTKARRARAKK